MITDEIVRKLFRNCQNALAPYWNDAVIEKNPQIHRGVTPLLWKNAYPANCFRHMLLFDKFNIIPRYCFNCYKVTIKPRTVLELFKLMILFDGIQLPMDNTRKCITEVRPAIPGTYAGFVYCQSLNEAKEILVISQNLVSKEISPNIPVIIKRGCSEYAIAYPEYNEFDNDGNSVMKYKDEWQEYEDRADKDNLAGHLIPNKTDTFNHPGINLMDAKIMLSWLKYAVAIGDTSYLKVTKKPIIKLHGPRLDARPAFHPPEDE